MLGLFLLFLTAFGLIVLLGSAGILWAILRPRRKTYAVALALDCPTHPTDLDLDGEEVIFNLPGGHTSPGWIIRGEKPDGPTVMVLHGHRDSRYGALYRAKTLAPYAGQVVVFDWPAHGECTAKWMTCGQREPADVLAVLDGLPQALSDKPVVLFGYSLGGQIALKTAGRYPRFAGVIADGPYRYWSSPIRMRAQRLGYPVLPFMPLVALVLRLIGSLRGFDRATWAAKIEVPVLVLHGTADRVCPHEEGRQIAEAAPKGRFTSIPDGPHNHLASHDPQRYHAALESFFAELAEHAEPQVPAADTLAT
ncbi:MAG: alpha/beta fold hydrolase [Planctomycetota bacterium]